MRFISAHAIITNVISLHHRFLIWFQPLTPPLSCVFLLRSRAWFPPWTPQSSACNITIGNNFDMQHPFGLSPCIITHHITAQQSRHGSSLITCYAAITIITLCINTQRTTCWVRAAWAYVHWQDESSTKMFKYHHTSQSWDVRNRLLQLELRSYLSIAMNPWHWCLLNAVQRHGLLVDIACEWNINNRGELSANYWHHPNAYSLNMLQTFLDGVGRGGMGYDEETRVIVVIMRENSLYQPWRRRRRSKSVLLVV